MSMSPKEMYAAQLGASVVNALERRHFAAWYVPTKEAALQKALELIPEGDCVSWGGSVTIEEIGLKQAVHDGPYTVLDRDLVPAQERAEIMRRALLCDTFITSTNALTTDGQLINIDGNGNRVAAMTYGPKSVLVLAGINKIVADEQAALSRIRTVAAPMNAQRFAGLKTPCAASGYCGDCISLDSLCSYIVTTRLCKPAGRIKVLIIGESLGF